MFLSVNELSVFSSDDVLLLSRVSFDMEAREIMAIVGESGGGKTTLLRSLAPLYPPFSGVRITGTVRFMDRNTLEMSEQDLTEMRKNSLRHIFQEPGRAFNPVMKIASQFKNEISSANRNNLTQKLTDAGIDDPRRILDSYPHQLSVGTLQRVMLAMALISSPKLILADEPTSAVDADLRDRMMETLLAACRKHGIALIFTTHDLQIARKYSDRIVMLFKGQIVEEGPTSQIIDQPLHPYSQLLIDSFLRSDGISLKRDFVLLDNPRVGVSKGCSFAFACPKVQPSCTATEPELIPVDSRRSVRCPYW